MSFRQNSVVLKQSGFGIVELLVSISIITMISAVVIARHNAFNGAVLLRNQAYEVAFAIHQAQLLAVSGSNPNSSVVQQYGVYFSPGNDYVTFRDNNADGKYDKSTDTQIGPAGKLDTKFQISQIIYNGTSAGTDLNVTFRRPNFDALFKTSASGAYQNGGSSFIDVRQVGTNDNKIGSVRRVEVTPTGQILVTEY